MMFLTAVSEEVAQPPRYLSYRGPYEPPFVDCAYSETNVYVFFHVFVFFLRVSK